MARNMRLILSRKLAAEPVEEDESGAEFSAYEPEPPAEPDTHAAPHYAIPMFLAEAAERAGRRRFIPSWNWNWNDATLRSRVTKAGGFMVAAAMIAFGIAYFEDSPDLFASIKASLLGTSTDQSVVTETSTPDAVAAAVQSSYGTSSYNTPWPATESTVGVRTGFSTAKPTPTREDIALALRTARQGQTDSSEPLAAVPDARGPSSDEAAVLVKRAKGLITLGDIVAARLMLERAAESQDADAALLLAQTYDPAVLGKPDVRTITPDSAAARSWYQRAAALGSLNARQRLAQMQN
jgi:hypothetical protein